MAKIIHLMKVNYKKVGFNRASTMIPYSPYNVQKAITNKVLKHSSIFCSTLHRAIVAMEGVAPLEPDSKPVRLGILTDETALYFDPSCTMR